jgi:uncharacterized protein (TIGR00369 family)
MKTPDLDALNALCRNTLMSHLGMRFVSLADGVLTIEMPVDACVKQPFGRVHGGAILALAETAGNALSMLHCPEGQTSWCVEINASHLRGATEGTLRAEARFVREGRSLHVLSVEVFDAAHELLSTCRMTTRVVSPEAPRPAGHADRP